MLKVGVILEELFNTTPQNVMDRMQDAVRNESALYSCEHKEERQDLSGVNALR